MFTSRRPIKKGVMRPGSGQKSDLGGLRIHRAQGLMGYLEIPLHSYSGSENEKYGWISLTSEAFFAEMLPPRVLMAAQRCIRP